MLRRTRADRHTSLEHIPIDGRIEAGFLGLEEDILGWFGWLVGWLLKNYENKWHIREEGGICTRHCGGWMFASFCMGGVSVEEGR